MSEEQKPHKPSRRDHGPQGTHVFSRGDVDKLIDQASQAEAGAGNRPQLKGVSVEVKGREFPLPGARAVIGRASSCDIILSDSSVSSEHARINHDAGGWRVVNLLSTNGTFVNDKRVSNEELHHGDRVRFGRVEFIFQDPEQAGGRSVHAASGKSARPIWPWAAGVAVVVVIALFFLLR